MSEINFCNTKEQLNHLGEVVTGKVDGSPSGADIDTSTLPYTGQVRKTLPALEAEYQEDIDSFNTTANQVITDKTAEFDASIASKESEADAAIDAYRLLSKGDYASGILLSNNFEYIEYNGAAYFATNPPYTTTSTTPDADSNLFIGGYISQSSISSYTDIVFKDSGGKSAIENMIDQFALNPLMYAVGTVIKTGGTSWRYEDSTGPITHENFRAFDAVNVIDAGAKGDGVTPCADAFIYATTLRCNTIYVPDGNIFLIEKEVDLKFKNLVGGGGMSQGTSANGLSEIIHPVGYTGALFSYPGAVVRDIYFRGNGGTATCFTRIGYNQEFKNNTFRVFDYALYSVGGTAGATVNLYVTGNFFSSNNTCFFSEDINNNQSTTTYFHRNEFNFNDNCIIFDKEVFGSSFTCNVFENVNVPIRGKAFYDCKFDTLWFEIVRDGATDKPIIVVDDEEQFARNTVGNLYLHPSSTWFNNISTDGTKAGGVFTTRDVLRVGNSIGGRVKIEDNYLRDDFNPFYGARRFGIKGSDQDPVSTLNTEVRIDHGFGGRLVFGHTDESRTTPVTHRRAIGPNSAGDGAYLGRDVWEANEERSWEAYDPDATGDVGKFRALQYLVYNGSTVSAGGYILARTSTGAFTLTRENGGIPSFTNPAITISGIEVASGFLVHKVIVGASTLQIFFADLSGALTDPNRFTLGFQNT